MNKRMNRIFRRMASVLAAGMLFQQGGCTLDLNSIATGLVTSIANNLITDLVFGALNVGRF